MAFSGLSDSLTVERPLALTALQTSENGASPSSWTRPRKSLVNNVPQPKEAFTRPANWACNSMILSTNSKETWQNLINTQTTMGRTMIMMTRYEYLLDYVGRTMGRYEYNKQT